MKCLSSVSSWWVIIDLWSVSAEKSISSVKFSITKRVSISNDNYGCGSVKKKQRHSAEETVVGICI